ncbi:hypothetical protein RYZ27_13990 [Hyphomonas sp. FCG-A18]|jgi:hypothetical protein|uniref:hypothetical protein n=1 Tax=Hyphomonas sp. FCG-A18 TaxID=3080019 RepID=UPI002B2CDED8|nr:hypothetical protein RYZ27_13990 [Hyphomonas sp. FCG-A18]
MAEKKYWYRNKARGLGVKIVPANATGFIVFIFNLAAILIGIYSVGGVADILPPYLGAILALIGLGLFIYSLMFKTDYSSED